MSHYTQLSVKERRQLAALWDMGWFPKAIAKRLGRHPSTIYRELHRNQCKQGYLPIVAHKLSAHRRQRAPCKLKVESAAYKYVLSKLQRGWSPEQISGRMKLLNLPHRVCHETIYHYLYRHARSSLWERLPTQRRSRKKRKPRRARRPYEGLRAIQNRPLEVEFRKIAGHWEGDTIRFSKQRSSSVTTLVERKTRFLVMCKNSYSTSSEVMNHIAKRMSGCPKKVWKTLTFDQGSEFADFAKIERTSRCKICYAKAHSPWQRGSNENTNGRVRSYLPRGTHPTKISQRGLDELAEILNNTPRKCLEFLTPKEAFSRAFSKRCRTSLWNSPGVFKAKYLISLWFYEIIPL